MAVSNEENRWEATGDGMTKRFVIKAKFDRTADIAVYLDGVRVTSGFTVEGAGNATGGAVVFAQAPGDGVSVIREIDPAVVQLLDLPNAGGGAAALNLIERGLDRLTLIAQVLKSKVERALIIPDGVNDDVAAFDARGFRLENVASPEKGADATNKDWVEQEVASQIDEKTLHESADGQFDAAGRSIRNLPEPTEEDEAATLGWVLKRSAIAGPQGEKGPDGDQGPEGPAGPVGPQGPIGPKGPEGDQGEQGPIGIQGPEGKRGPIGPEGPAGEQGPQGMVGPQGPTGPRGSEGVQGPIGIQGPQGPQGAEGPMGESYEVDSMGLIANRAEYDTKPYMWSYLAIDEGKIYWKLSNEIAHWTDGIAFGRGPTGSQGPQGPQGVKGEKGDLGPQGEAGPQGPQGIEGPTGATGPRGPEGPEGPEGQQGVVGPQGPQGIQGVKGETGIQGPIGPHGPTGPQGPKGDRGAIWRGSWSAAMAYVVNDLAEYDGSTYIALASSSNVAPPGSLGTKWSLFAEAGSASNHTHDDRYYTKSIADGRYFRTYSSGDLYLDNKAVIANDSEGATADRKGSNIDHLWHDDGNNAWHFCSDAPYKSVGNSKLYIGELHSSKTAYIGANGAGESVLQFWDDKAKDWRAFYWSNYSDALIMENADGSKGKIWNSANDGPGSGLDADKLGGKDSSAFAKASDLAGISGWPGVYTGSDAAFINFPVGSYVITTRYDSGSWPLNKAVTLFANIRGSISYGLYIATTGDPKYVARASRLVVPGTWVNRSEFGDTFNLLQRIA